MNNSCNYIKQPAEIIYKTELEALIKSETKEIPEGWKMSPNSVYTYIMGGRAGDTVITPKYIGNSRTVELAIATLLTDKSLLLVGEPGTGKSWLSEHLAAAIHGDSTNIIHGTAGTTEDNIKYSWNYAMLLANGPSIEALIKSPLIKAMECGGIVRFEELTRCIPEVQDVLISILSDKRINISELNLDIIAKKGFSVIATSNIRDKGVHEMSSALKRRFNIIKLSTPLDIHTEINIVQKRISELTSVFNIKNTIPSTKIIEKIVTIFRELRTGITVDSKEKINTVSSGLSTAEAISLLINSSVLANNFGSGEITDEDIAACLISNVIKNEEKDYHVWYEYMENIMKKRNKEWKKLYKACKELNLS